MKKNSFALLILLIFAGSAYSQYQVIYQPPANRTIQTIASFSNTQNSHTGFYLSLSGNQVSVSPPYWIRFFRNNNTWSSNPHNNFLAGTVCFNGTGGFAFSSTAEIRRSPLDTNFFLTRFDWIACNNFESGYRNKRTRNSGAAFSDVSNVGLYDMDIDRINDSIIYGVGAEFLGPFKFWSTTNRGSNWSSVSLTGSAITIGKLKINPLRRGEIYFSVNQTLYRTTNAGANYTQLYVFSSIVNQLELDPVDTSIFVLTQNGNVFRSVNAGSNFTQAANVSLSRILFTPENHLRLYGAAQNGLYISTNGGVNWALYFDNFSGSSVVNGIVKYPNDGDTVYASNSTGLYKIWASVIGINQISTEVPSTYSLSQNYPNPFNPETKFRFSIPGQSVAQTFLAVYDILGKQVAVLVNQNLQPGTYEVNWNAADYPSGVYFYTLKAGVYTETKKMVLMK